MYVTGLQASAASRWLLSPPRLQSQSASVVPVRESCGGKPRTLTPAKGDTPLRPAGRRPGQRGSHSGDGLLASRKTKRPVTTRPSDPAPRCSPREWRAAVYTVTHTRTFPEAVVTYCSNVEAAEMFFRVGA